MSGRPARPGLVRLATRSSPLALWQAEHVAAALRAGHPGLEVELVRTDTVADRRLDVPLSVLGGKGVFAVEVQRLVLDGRADAAVHSAKDLPALTAEELVLAALPARGDARDALVGAALADLPPAATVATGSQRRLVQLRARRPDLAFVGLRGNIATRLDAVGTERDGRRVDAVVVAAAALVRLGEAGRAAEWFDPDVMVPQVGQGALAVEARAGDDEVVGLLAVLDHAPTRAAVEAERAFLAELGGDCELPAGAHAGPPASDGTVSLVAVLADEAGTVHRAEDTDGDGPALGARLARGLRRRLATPAAPPS